ncbi:MAG: FAD-dependent oxidoreductase [Ruminococcaceae bacterium]|nr:FAD-dependent oxidoreductase [Oscillospiraceae bacterium]
MKQSYDLLILGATALASGILAANPKLSAVVLESSSLAAGEFSNAYKGGNAPDFAPTTAAASDLKDECIRRKVFFDGAEWLPAITPIIANRMADSGADLYFFAGLKEIAAEDDGYRVTFSGFGIDHSFTANRIIDTTSKFVSHAFFGASEPEMAQITLNHYDGEQTLHSLPCGDDIASARAELVKSNENILKIATELCYSPAASRMDFGAAAWIPSAAYDNFLAAYDAGASAALPSGKASTSAPEAVQDGAFDVIVIGLGTAGAIAAVTAMEEGLRVLGLENLPVGGGAGTAGSVLGYYFGYKGGVYRALDERAKGYNSKFVPTGGIGADQKILEIDASLAGSDFRYGAIFTDVKKSGNRVTGAVWYENGVRHEADAKFVLDCSADSAALVNAGCEMLGGRAIDGAMQPFSCVYYKYVNGRLGYGYVDNGRVNQYDPDDFGRSVIKAISSHVHLRDSYHKEYMGVAPLIGLREGWRIVGEETVIFADMIDGKWPVKPVYYGWSNLDNHGKDNMLESRIYEDWNSICGMWGWGVCLPVPMGALIPKGVDGILAGGRNVSVDHDIAMGLRMKDDAQKSGETAARLAAMAIRGGISAKDVDVDELRTKLYASGCLKAEDEIIRIEKQKCDEVYEFPLWCDDDAAITEGLASDAPAYFMWSARSLGKRGLLTALLDSDDEKTRINAALTLTLLDESSERIVSILTDAAAKRDGYIAKAGRKYIVPRSIAAISALGRIGAADAVPVLLGMIADEGYLDEIPFEPYDLMVDREDFVFQYRANLISALCRIAAKNPEIAGEIKAKLTAFMDGKRLAVSMMGPIIRYDDTPVFAKMIDSI